MATATTSILRVDALDSTLDDDEEKVESSQKIESKDDENETTNDLMQSLSIISEYHFGGYAKIKEELINFVRNFYQTHQFKWDLIYNGKMAYGVYDMIEKDYFPKESKILLIHTGGLQGINGFEERNKRVIYE